MSALSVMRMLIMAGVTLFIGILLSACGAQAPAQEVALEVLPTTIPRIIFVTPTPVPSLIPTVTAQPSTVPITPTYRPTHTPDYTQAQAQCRSMLTNLYTEASESCLGEPTGYFCNGGGSPRAQPRGNVNDLNATFSQLGALVPVNVVSQIDLPALLQEDGGGMMWVRFDAPTAINALLLGSVSLRDSTPADSNLADWQVMTVRTHDTPMTELPCDMRPKNTFIVQGPWGQATHFALNGVSVELSGSLAVQTQADETAFIVLEGQALFRIFGQTRLAYAGQQLNVAYADNNFNQPSAIPPDAVALEFDHIRALPVPLLDRPILLPQPGYARTRGNVNMRAEPSVNSKKLAEIPDDQLMTIIAMNTDRTWYHVRLPNGENGWMRADLVAGEIGEIVLNYDATPLPPERYGDARHTARVSVPTGANLRRAPDVQFDVIRTLPEGTEVEILAQSPYSPFVQVDTGTELGWLSLLTIETTTVIQFLPINYDVPLPPGPTATPYYAFGGGHAYPDPRSGN